MTTTLEKPMTPDRPPDLAAFQVYLLEVVPQQRLAVAWMRTEPDDRLSLVEAAVARVGVVDPRALEVLRFFQRPRAVRRAELARFARAMQASTRQLYRERDVAVAAVLHEVGVMGWVGPR